MSTLIELVQRIESFSGSYAELQTLHAEARRQLSQLRAALQLWRESSTDWEARSREAEATSRRLTASLDELSRRLSRSGQAIVAERGVTERQLQDRERQVKVWQAIGLGAIIAAVLGWLTAALT